MWYYVQCSKVHIGGAQCNPHSEHTVSTDPKLHIAKCSREAPTLGEPSYSASEVLLCGTLLSTLYGVMKNIMWDPELEKVGT